VTRIECVERSQSPTGIKDRARSCFFLTRPKTHILLVTHYSYSEYELTRQKKAYAIRGCSFRFNIAILGPTFPNRAYLMAATSFGHLITSHIFPPTGGYKPVNGTIFEIFSIKTTSPGTTTSMTHPRPPACTPHRTSCRCLSSSPGHQLAHLTAPPAVASLPRQAAAGTLTQVSFVDPNFGLAGTAFENDEHPPTDMP
jgi:hypothetical protein